MHIILQRENRASNLLLKDVILKKKKKKPKRLHMKFLTFIYRGEENGSVLGEGRLSKQFFKPRSYIFKIT